MSDYSCDAIIINTDEVRFLPLAVTAGGVQAIIESTPRLNRDVLEWLWDRITEPVLEELGFHDCPADDESWPRIYWIPTGLLTRLPLHAAGYHGIGGNKTVMDRVISSYSVSVAALVQAHDHLRRHADRKPENAVLIGMQGLTGAPKEIQRVADICQSMKVKMPKPFVSALLEALKACDVFHFAGHGSSNSQDPSQSALILAGQDRLTVSSLLDINLHKRKPFLAFLSACSTGQVRREDLVDEGLHLIAACQVAGFRHVIGTLWEVYDSSCVIVAEIVYEHMQIRGMAHESVSEGLHRASRTLRDSWVAVEHQRIAKRDDTETDVEIREAMRPVVAADEGGEEPLVWAPYVHYGI